MRGGTGLSLVMALAGCATTVEPHSRYLYVCASEEPGPPGTLEVSATLVPDHPARYFGMAWRRYPRPPGLALQVLWRGALAAPPDRAEVYMYVDVPRALATTEHRLELRALGNGRALARGPWMAGPSGITSGSTHWGRLKTRLEAGGVEAVIIDRSGRILLRETLDPALSRAPALGLDAARRRWATVVGNREQRCPERTMKMQEVFVT